MPAPKDYKAVRDILRQYMDASVTADVSTLKSIFHPNAVMAGNFEGKAEVGDVTPFYEELSNSPSAKDSGENYQAEIGFINIVGDIASASIIEDNLLGMNYVNHFQLLKIAGDWKITSKIYTIIKPKK